MSTYTPDAVEEMGLIPAGSVKAKGSIFAGADAMTKAVQSGKPFRCARLGQNVTMDSCVKRKLEGNHGTGYWPCAECSIVASHMRKMGIEHKTSGEKIVAKVNNAKVEVPVKKEQVNTDPFAGWEKLTTERSISRDEGVFVSLQEKRVAFSHGMSIEFGLDQYESVDVSRKGTVIGFQFRADADGLLKLYKDNSKVSSKATHISSKGICRAFGLNETHKARYAVDSLGSGAFMVDFSKPMEKLARAKK